MIRKILIKIDPDEACTCIISFVILYFCNKCNKVPGIMVLGNLRIKPREFFLFVVLLRFFISGSCLGLFCDIERSSLDGR